jgi:NAD(P)H dehydrogenase (quinone)
MPELLVLYYSRHGAIRDMARLVARGIEQVPGASARLRTVPQVASVTTVAQPAIPEAGAPYCELADLEQCAGIALGSPTRFGNMAAPMKHFWDGTGALWLKGALAGKPAAVFTSTSSQHGGQETTLFSIIANLLHFGMVVVGLPYSHQGQMTMEEIAGGSPYGATTIAGGDGSRQPSAIDLAGARHQGELVARTAIKLHG